jgi:hypothetical protein
MASTVSASQNAGKIRRKRRRAYVGTGVRGALRIRAASIGR